ncbi:MAG: outer membrane protein assembly factor BamA [Gammaproteobacteria bacterium]
MFRVFNTLALTGALLFFANNAHAVSFVIKDIELQGLGRIEAGTVFTYLPIQVGERFTEERGAEIVSALYDTGFFSDITLRRRGDVLIVVVTERPAISGITFDGNEDISDEDLTEALRSVEIARGRVFNRSVLERLEQELTQQYLARGKYNARIRTKVTPLERNRVNIKIDISEGEVASIKRVNVVGNEAFEEDELTEDFASGIPAWWAFFSSRDQYSQEKLTGDLELLRTHYLDEGYLQFNIDSTQVSITPDKRDIYIGINIDEGEQYTVRDARLAGTFIVPRAQLERLLAVKPGQTFSRARVVRTVDDITRRLGNEGYAFANINPIPEIDEASKEVSLTFFVDPGQRIYVRRINILGNTTTSDEVYRRELRQIEGGWYNLSDIELSRQRIQRLPYVETVEVDTARVPGVDDMVDLNISVKERLAGNFAIGAGYSQSQGLLFNLSVTQENFLGTGRRVGVRFDNSDYNTVYNISYTNPYYTIDGVSRGFNLNYSRTDASEANISDYDAQQLGGDVEFGIPFSEFDTLRTSAGYRDVNIDTNVNTSPEIRQFLIDNGDAYNIFELGASLIHDTRNKTVFADRGNLQQLNLEVAVPGGDLQYYRTDYSNLGYIPLTSGLTLSLNGEVAYGDGYSGTTDLPFFEKYYGGGFGTVRGYAANTLGPRDSTQFRDPLGGNFSVVSNIELLFPPPFTEEASNLRFGLFFDAGNVFEDVGAFDTGEIRTSVGVSTSWITPVGALTFSLAQALNDQPGDETEVFQFNIGTIF